MPKLRKYKDGSGFYIRTTFAGKDTPKGKKNIVTYQVTPAGEEHLKRPGCFRRPLGDGSEISYDELMWMYRRGFLTTGGTGPGQIEDLPRGDFAMSAIKLILSLIGLVLSTFWRATEWGVQRWWKTLHRQQTWKGKGLVGCGGLFALLFACSILSIPFREPLATPTPSFQVVAKTEATGSSKSEEVPGRAPQPTNTPAPTDTLRPKPTNTPLLTNTSKPTVTPSLIVTSTPGRISARIVQVIDGDTIEVEIDGQRHRVRYIGVDTPERGDPFFEEATLANQRLVEEKLVELEKDVSETDRYGRLLRYVYMEGLLVNAELVRQGYARVATFPPDVRYQDLFLSLEREAREAERGLWAPPAAAPTQTSTPLPTKTFTATSTPRQPTATSTTTPPPQADAVVVVPSLNVRSGPGVAYGRVGSVSQGDELEVTGRNADASWLVITAASGLEGWVSASPQYVRLNIDPMTDVPFVAAPPTPTPGATNTPVAPAPTQPPAVPSPTQPPAPTGNVVISFIFFDGVVPRVESDEYAEITNTGGAPVNLAGWRLNAGDPGQDFIFPDFVIQPGQVCRVYTNEHHPETCGFSFGSGRAIWNNKGDCGHLYNATGVEVSQRCY